MSSLSYFDFNSGSWCFLGDTESNSIALSMPSGEAYTNVKHRFGLSSYFQTGK